MTESATSIVVNVTPRLLDRRRMAAALCLSESVLDDLRKKGCPSIAVPGVKRILFNPDKVVAWLEEQQEQPEPLSADAARAECDRIFGPIKRGRRMGRIAGADAP